MLIYPEINPVALDLGPVKIHWYGVMYLLAFAQFWFLGKLRARRPGSGWNEKEVDDLIFYGAMGVILGGRLGYTFFYNFSAFTDDPLMVLRIWEGGMSFHGGLIGVIVAMWMFARKKDVGFFSVADFVAPLVPLGYFIGRMGNFINGELWGRPTDAAWGMVFPHVDNLARHPSMLYQGILEGLVVFVMLWIYSNKPRPAMAVSAMFLILFGLFRFVNEFFRQPDAHLGFIAFDWLTMGQLLSVPMVIAGFIMLNWSYKKAGLKN
jgi:phosphatidylglycerol:prolipoprotein diacylglycerol transferase